MVPLETPEKCRTSFTVASATALSVRSVLGWLFQSVDAKTPNSPKLVTSPSAVAVDVPTLFGLPLMPDLFTVAESSEPSVLLVQDARMLKSFWAQTCTDTEEEYAGCVASENGISASTPSAECERSLVI